jgi:glycosyltransferase 2 family protein
VDGRSFDKAEPHELSDAVLTATWELVASLQRHRVAHRDLRLANLFLARDGHVWLIDFGFAELAASDTLLRTDLAELTTALSLRIDAERAVASALPVVGRRALQAALPRLRPDFLSGATRTGVHERPHVLDEIRHAVGDEPATAAPAQPVGGTT